MLVCNFHLIIFLVEGALSMDVVDTENIKTHSIIL
jgi:hypothetical protein